MQANQDHLKKFFENKALFEEAVFNVKNEKDRREILNILADTFVRDTLKEHLNFMHINNVSDFTLEQIINILFKEIANEWIDYAVHDLKLSKDEALEALQHEERVRFIKLLAEDYYKCIKKYIFEKIADSFIDLLVFNSQENTRSVFINAVINSDFILDRRILNINSSDQLCRAAKRAKELKDEKLHTFKKRIEQIQKGRSQLNIPKAQRDEFAQVYAMYEKKIKEVQMLKLENFDEMLLSVKKALISALKMKG